MKNTKVGFQTILLVLWAGLICTCTSERDSNCESLPTPIEINLNDTLLVGLQFSPFEDGKIWVRSRKERYWEVDIKSGNGMGLSLTYQQFFSPNTINGTHPNSQQDPYEKIIWAIDNHTKPAYFDQRSKHLEYLGITGVYRIIVQKEVVILVGALTIHEWNRKSRTLSKVAELPSGYANSTFLFQDSLYMVSNGSTYNLNTKQFKLGISFSNNSGDNLSVISIGNGMEVLKSPKSIFYISDNKVRILPLNLFENIFSRGYSNGQFWCSDQNYYYTYNPDTDSIRSYSYTLPQINSFSVQSYLDNQYIWLSRPDQVMLIDRNNNQHYSLLLNKEQGYQQTISDACNAYTLYKNQLVIRSMTDFISQCQPFDAAKYQTELKQFQFVLDSVQIYTNHTTKEALAKINYLTEKFGSLKHIEIAKSLEYIKIGAFQNIHFAYPDEYIACYSDSTLPNVQRLSCLGNLLSQHVYRGNYKKVLEAEKAFKNLLVKLKPVPEFDFSTRDIDSIRCYLKTIDSLDKSNLPADSLLYAKAMALHTVRLTGWYCHSGCGGCSTEIVEEKLEAFVALYPRSTLADNAAFDLIKLSFYYDYIDAGKAEEINNKYQAFLQKYPDSDKRADVYFSIFGNLSDVEIPEKPKIKAAARKFIQNFSTDPRVQSVIDRMKDLQIEGI